MPKRRLSVIVRILAVSFVGWVASSWNPAYADCNHKRTKADGSSYPPVVRFTEKAVIYKLISRAWFRRSRRRSASGWEKHG
jgi:hypothetical protein